MLEKKDPCGCHIWDSPNESGAFWRMCPEHRIDLIPGFSLYKIEKDGEGGAIFTGVE